MVLDAAMMSSLTAVAAVAVALSFTALAWLGWGAAMGVATGGLLATLNLYVIALVSRGVLSGGAHGKWWGIAGGAKFLALLGIAFLLLQSGLVSGLALAAGYAALPVGVTLGILAAAPRKESPQRSV